MKTWKSILILIALVFCFFPTVFIGKQTFYYALWPAVYPEGPNQFSSILRSSWLSNDETYTVLELPMSLSYAKAIRSLTAPFWDPFVGCGFPMSAEISTGLYNPLRAPLWVLGVTPRTIDIAHLLKFFIAGLGMFLFLKSLNLSNFAVWVGTIGFMFCGYFRLWIPHWTTYIDCLNGWILWSLSRLAIRCSFKNFFVAGIFIGLSVLGGNPQATIQMMLLAFAYYVFVRVDQWRMKAEGEEGDAEAHEARLPISQVLLRSSAMIGLLTLFAIIIAAPLVFDFSAFFFNGWQRHSAAGSLSSSYYAGEALHGWRWQSLVSLLFSPLMFIELAKSSFTATPYSVLPYVGIGIWTLACWCWGKARERNKTVLFFAIYLFFYISLMARAPYIVWIYKLPLFGLIHFTSYFATFHVVFPVLAAFGLENILRKEHKPRVTAAVFSMLGIFVLSAYITDPYSFKLAFVGPLRDIAQFAGSKVASLPSALQGIAGSVIGSMSSLRHDFIWIYIMSVFFLFVGAQFLASKTNAMWVKYCCVAGVFIELFVYAPKLMPKMFDYFKAPPYVEFLQERTRAQPGRVLGMGYMLMPNWSSIYGLEDIRFQSGVVPKRYALFLANNLLTRPGVLADAKDLRKLYEPLRFIGTQETLLDKEKMKFIDFLGVRYLIGRSQCVPIVPYQRMEEVCKQSGLTLPSEFPLLYEQDNVNIYESTGALSKAFMVYDTVFAKQESNVFRIFQNADFDFKRTAIIEDRELGSNISISSPTYSVKALKKLSDSVAYEVSTSDAGLLVVSDVYYPGWKAYIDGNEVPLRVANYAFRGVRVPAGEHVVEFHYKPWWVYLGFALSLMLLFTSFIKLIIDRVRESS
ncbi:YfhO family protein [Elusimicrobiota bacterium]